MSVENHPNINAAGFTVDIVEAFYKHLRGNSVTDLSAAGQILHTRVIDFVSDISEHLDTRFQLVR